MGEPLTNGNGGQYDVEANVHFDSKEYLKRFVDPLADPMRVHVKFLSAWHQFYDKYAAGGDSKKRLLEFGGGPTLYSLISASRYIESVTFAEYAESNRNEIAMWREGAPGGKCCCVCLSIIAHDNNYDEVCHYDMMRFVIHHHTTSL